jgi:LmbE family N-acetylglucosaminyl deacetylase
VITAGELHRLWRGLPFGTLDDVIGGGTCLILAPHPDDESLGCGGLIATCCAASRPPVVAVLTDGAASHPGSRLYPPAKLADLREREAVKAVGILGLAPERLLLLREPDGHAPHEGAAFDAVVDYVVRCLREEGCTSVLTSWRFDPHCDHLAAALIAAEAARAAGVRLVSYPVWGWTLADDAELNLALEVRGWRLDVGRHADAKCRAIAAHASQYGGVVTDDPAGFRLPEALLRAMRQKWEIFLLS